jgi:serine/threonine-protein kinase
VADLIAHLSQALAGGYTIERELGAGGMATVFLAQDLKHDRRVALKVLAPELAAMIGPERFLREIRVMARLAHPHILPLLDSGDANGMLFYTMPVVDGESLRDRFDRDQQLQMKDVAALTDQIARALDRAHEHGIVHRDIKPENILLDEENALVADFGIAGLTEEVEGEGITATGLAIGTCQYMSPEQVAATKVDGRSDVYSLACVAYEAMTGRPVFTGPTMESIARQHLTTDPVPVTTLRSAVPSAVDAVFRRALAKTPGDRFATAGEFAAALKGALDAPARGAPTSSIPWIPVLGGAAVIAVVAGAIGFLRFDGTPVAPRSIGSVAVLPFENLSGDDEQSVFVDGIHDALIAELSRVSAFDRVVQRNSVMRFKGSTLPLAEIAESLSVGALLTGTVLPAINQVRVNVALIEASTEQNLWNDIYLEDLRDILTLQRTITSEIAREIAITLTPDEQARLAEERPVDPDALFAYLQGREHWNTRSDSGLQRAIEYFEQAIDIDSTYAQAYAGLSDAYNMQVQYGYVPRSERIAPQLAAAQQAIRWDPTLANAHVALGEVSFLQRDWETAQRAYERAVNLDPRNAVAQHFYGWFLSHMGRHEEAVNRLRRARDLDPVSPSINADLAGVNLHDGRYNEAKPHIDRALELQPDHAWGLWVAMLIAIGQEDNEAAMGFAERRDRVWGLGSEGRAHVLAAMGNRDEAHRLLDGIIQDVGTVDRMSVNNMMSLANVYAELGEVESAIDWIERAVDAGLSASGYGLLAWPFFDPLRSHPRFDRLIDRMGYPR